MQNIARLYNLLNEFWERNIPGINEKDELMQEGIVFQFGAPPNRIDLINSIENVGFIEAWKNRVNDSLSRKGRNFKTNYIGLNELIKNKNAVNRFRDKEDLKFLNQLKKNNYNDH